MHKRMLLILNPAAGQKRANRYLTDMVALFNANGYMCTVFCTAARGEATRIAKEQAQAFDMIACIGGDGTLNEVISGLLDSGVSIPIGYIPSGSTNDFASSLGLSRDIMTAARDIVQGAPVALDAGSFNGRRFTYVASFGAFTEASYATPQSAKNALGHLAYVLEGVLELPNIRPVHLALDAAGQHFEGDYIFGAISNATRIGGVLALDKERVSLNDGLFEITLIKTPQTIAELSRIAQSLQTRQYDPELISFCTAQQADIFASADMPWTLDGEYAPGSAHIHVEALPQAIHMLLKQRQV